MFASFAVVAAPEKVSAEYNKQDNKCADVKAEQVAVEKNHKQYDNPKDITTCVAFVASFAAATATDSAESAK